MAELGAPFDAATAADPALARRLQLFDERLREVLKRLEDRVKRIEGRLTAAGIP